MFVPLTEKERQAFFNQNNNSFIPGYTGHCPSLRFHYGTCYGTKTKEILQNLRDSNVIRQIVRDPYRPHEVNNAILKPIIKTKGQMKDYSLNSKYRAPRYIIGYTGFVPTLNFRYGKSYGRAADDSRNDFARQQHNQAIGEVNGQEQVLDPISRMGLGRSASAPNKIKAIRSQDEVAYSMRKYDEKPRLKERNVSANFPPIAGYTGHIPKFKDSLSQRYKTVVCQSLADLEDQRKRKHELRNAQTEIENIVDYNKNLNGANKHL